MNKLQRRTAAGLLALSAMVAVPTAALAAEKDEGMRMRLDYVLSGVDNPCTPQFDDITLTMTGQVRNVTWHADDGSLRAQSFVQVHGTGEAADGTRYVGGNQFLAHTDVSDGLASIISDSGSRLVSSGSAPNFDFRYKVLITFETSGTGSTFEVIQDRSECVG